MIRTIQTTSDSGSADEYFLYFYGINHSHLGENDQEFWTCRLRSTVLFTTENSLSALICKVWCGGNLSMLALNFWYEIRDKINKKFLAMLMTRFSLFMELDL